MGLNFHPGSLSMKKFPHWPELIMRIFQGKVDGQMEEDPQIPVPIY